MFCFVFVFQNGAETTRNTYRRYLTESGKAIPRTTAWRHFKHRLYRLAAKNSTTNGIIGVSQTANITESDNEVTTGDENSGLSTNTEEVESMQDRSDTEEAEVDQIEEVEVVPEIKQEMEEISDTDKSAIGDTESESENDVFQGRVFDGCQLDPSFLQPLYSGASINICMTYCIIMQYVYKYKLSYKAMEGLIHLLHLI
ncbi:hypothetical protein EMCRGX_G001882, partial [Ephydatia muelleri]